MMDPGESNPELLYAIQDVEQSSIKNQMGGSYAALAQASRPMRRGRMSVVVAAAGGERPGGDHGTAVVVRRRARHGDRRARDLPQERLSRVGDRGGRRR